ncbi:MAG: ribosome maturation factor RimM [Prevotellaceae bacterium]|jgi:16S rRNA processing protein RimM|nr:ribosome maturation factor RimM [Prevotellaceae bacterium]
MIKKEDVFQVGKLIRPHGLRGELLFEFSTDIFDEAGADYFICEIDGIFVPYFIEYYRLKGDDSGIIKFDGINSDREAKELIKVNLYLERKTLPDGFSPEDVHGTDFYAGYQITDQDGNIIGKIAAIDDSTENILFCVLSPSDNEILIPASDDYILGIDDEARVIQMEIPEGLLDLD